MQEQFDVIVVGGGPAGSTAATFCARAGFSVALFEHKLFPRHKVCGDVLNPGCWPVFEQLGVAGKIRALPQHPIHSARFATNAGASIDVPIQACAIRRSQLDAALLEHARACGVIVFEGEAVRGIPEPLTILTGKGRYLARQGIIAADGRHSIFAKPSEPAQVAGPIAFQAHFRAPSQVDGTVQLHLFPSGYCGVVRVDDEHVNVCIVTDRAGARLHDDCEALFHHTVWHSRQFRALGIVPEPVTPLHSAHPLVTSMNAPRHDRVWLVGDALQTREPFTGQGIFFALRTGALAVQSIRSGNDYLAAARELYARRGRTNRWLRHLMYHDRLAAPVIQLLRRWPNAVRWLADNVNAHYNPQ